MTDYPRDAARLSLERVLGLERENARLRKDLAEVVAGLNDISDLLKDDDDDERDPERIYLEPGDGDPMEGRQWCEDNVWADDEMYDEEATAYVRGDLYDEAREARNAALEVAAAKPDQATVDALKQTIGNLDRLLDESRAERDETLKALRQTVHDMQVLLPSVRAWFSPRLAVLNGLQAAEGGKGTAAPSGSKEMPEQPDRPVADAFVHHLCLCHRGSVPIDGKWHKCPTCGFMIRVQPPEPTALPQADGDPGEDSNG